MYQVMLVDDESSALNELTHYINRVNPAFHVVAKALGAEEALFYLGMIHPDLVITDIKMPVIDGLTMLKGMREAGWLGYAAIITGHDDFAFAQQAIRLNVFEYLLKPVFPDDISALLDRIECLLRQTGETGQDQTEPEPIPPFKTGVAEEACRLPAYILQAKAYIHAHYSEPLTLSKLAKVVAVNPTYLSYRFSKYCGQNFLEYLTGYRIAKAKELLKQSNLQIQEIAGQVGYMDIAYFTRVFRRETGVTPRNYRSSGSKGG